MPRFTTLAWPLLLVIGVASASADESGPTYDSLIAELTATMRGLIEPQFEANTGLTFTSFECRIDGVLEADSRFDCDAVDEEGDRIRYTLEVDDEGTATVVLASQPAAELSAADRAVLEPPCRAFLTRFDDADWSSLIADLHPSLLDTTGSDEIRASLDKVRSALGDIRDIHTETYARHNTGRHELEYRLDCANGPGTARFGLLEDGDALKVAFYAVTPAPGSPLYAELLENEARGMVSGLIGREIARVDLPFDALVEVGDTAEGSAWLEDGDDVVIAAIRHGRADDFDVVDFTFRVLDVPWMIRRAFADRPDPTGTIDCPTRTAPDGGTVTCGVTLTSGTRLEVTVARHGGDHRIVDVQPAG
ncbi:MAG: hypothetical protein PVG53_00455 [Holophagae bacterium]|jgi:hypothetical protein